MPKPSDLLGRLAFALVTALAAMPVAAERADRGKPLEIEADRNLDVNLGSEVAVLTGNVLIRKGTLQIRADRVEVRTSQDGFRTAIAFGSGRPATFRQKRDAPNEFIDGQADRLEYEERGDVVRFVNNAVVRRLRGTTVGDEVTGSLITYDGTRETFKASNAPAGSSPATADSGRVRVTLMPREGSEAAADAARHAEPGASAPGSSAAPPAPASTAPAPRRAASEPRR
jgi:lipopolysaccharide export system protein LptA